LLFAELLSQFPSRFAFPVAATRHRVVVAGNKNRSNQTKEFNMARPAIVVQTAKETCWAACMLGFACVNGNLCAMDPDPNGGYVAAPVGNMPDLLVLKW